MSNHYFETLYQGQRVRVDLGWDRPLGHHFLVIMKLELPQAQHASLTKDAFDDEDEYDDEIVYSNLNEPDAFNLSLGHYRAKLQELGIQVPEAMFEQAALDGRHNVGNRVVTYAADGSFW